ncbi:MAG: sialidase [Acidobacteria bacterium]|nr:MAG: sialidase [Acidobacteriota bacterium]
MLKRACLVLFIKTGLLFGAAPFVRAQQPPTNPEVYSQLQFRYIGPVGNRTTAVTGVPGQPYLYYVGAASGGIFKTTDGGIHWEPIFDAQPVSSIGSLAVAGSDANVVWAGTGESFIRSHISVGSGIYRSLDAGKTWTAMGLEKTGRIGNVIIDPHHPEIVLACALGHAYGPQPERGVFRTTDGGKSWERVLFVNEKTGCSDLAMDPGNPHILFAGMWQVEIHTYGRTSGGPGSGLFKSTDGGATWKRLEDHGLPKPPVGRIAVRVAQRDSERVYALIETGDGVPIDGKTTQSGQLWRSDDGGENWQLVNSDRQIRGRTHYYTREEIAPDNENEVYFFSAAFSRTLDGGHTLTNMPAGPGGDNHEMWIDPTNGDRMAVVNDGGVSISVNRGHTWDHVQLPIAQIYHVTVDDQIPYFVYGNKQDGPSYRGPSNSLQFAGFGGGGGGGGQIPRSVWHPVAGSESGFATPDPVDNNIIWSSGTGSGSVGGAMARFDERNRQARDVEVWPEDVSGASAAEVKYRFNWEFPITISPHDHNKVYVGSQYVHVTTDGGNSWQMISPDLTRNDKSRQQISGGLTPDNIGVEYAGTVFAIAESPKEAGVIWAGTNDGLVQITRDGGKSWSDVTKNIPNLPEWGTVSNIEASRYDAGTAYITVDFHQMDNRDPFAYETRDYGRVWTAITKGIPHSMLSYAHCIREDPVRKGLLYLGTENGLYVSFDDGKNWQPLQNSLPHAPVYWIAVQERFHDLALATYGRGFWILDDLTPLQQLTAEVLASNAHLFAPRAAYRFRPVAQPAAVFYDPAAGHNPPFGAVLNFYLKANLGEKDRARLTISDASGKVVREIECRPARPEGARPAAGPGSPGGAGRGEGGPDARPCEAKAGINRYWWDLRCEPSREIKLRTTPLYAPDVTVGPEGWRPAPGAGRISLLAPPGTYTVTLAWGEEKFSQKLSVLKDPHSSGSESDIQTQTQLLTALREEMNTIADSVNQIESVRAQIGALEKELGTDDNAQAIRKAAEDLAEKLVAVEGKVLQLKATGRGQDDVRWAPMLLQKINYLASAVGSSDFPPTTQQVAVKEELNRQGEQYAQEFQQLLAKDIAAFNTMLRERNVSNIIAKTP